MWQIRTLGWRRFAEGTVPKGSARVVHGVLCDTSFFVRWAKQDDPPSANCCDWIKAMAGKPPVPWL
jgi:hypothetical protein